MLKTIDKMSQHKPRQASDLNYNNSHSDDIYYEKGQRRDIS